MKGKMKQPLVYYGGKQTMLRHILPLVPEHEIYTEAYAGGASVLFAKKPSRTEVINDLNGELINFYRVCQTQSDELREEISTSLHSRELHEHAYHIYRHPTFFNTVQRAWATWYSLKCSFSAQIGGGFSYDRYGKKAHALQTAIENISEELVARLKFVTIEQKEAMHVISVYDSPSSFHFVDPPYIDCNQGHYGNMFNEQSLRELLELLSTLNGKFMLTMYPNEMIESYANSNGWKIHEVDRTVTAARVKRRKQAEWMVCNYVV